MLQSSGEQIFTIIKVEVGQLSILERYHEVHQAMLCCIKHICL